VIDPRTLAPLDREAILASVARTGRAVIASEDAATCGFGAEVAALLADRGLFHLLAPVRRVCLPDTPIPFAPALEQEVIPQIQDILRTVREVLEASS
jgi:pyruvate dehydrogenase E1 component beta subunit